MTYERLKQLKPSTFKRRCGVHRQTFYQMVSVLRPHLDRQGKRGGRCKLSVEDQLLVALGYWREYRSQFHIAETWGVSESTVCRIVQKVEALLLQSGQFCLPGKKQVYQNAYEWHVVLIDVAETPIERPKKTETVLQWHDPLRGYPASHPQSSAFGRPTERPNPMYCV